MPPAALLLFAGDPKPEQIALRLRHPGVAVLVGQAPPLRERPPAGIFLLLPHGSLPLSLSLRLPLQGGGRRPQAGGWGPAQRERAVHPPAAKRGRSRAKRAGRGARQSS